MSEPAAITRGSRTKGMTIERLHKLRPTWEAKWPERVCIDGNDYFKLKTGDKLQVGDVYPCHDPGSPTEDHDWELSDQTSMSNDWIRSGNVYYRPGLG